MVTVLHLSDTHLCAAPGGPVMDADPDARLTAVLDAVRRRGVVPDLVVHTGDVTDDGSPSAARRVMGQLEALRCTVVTTPGNHDAGAELGAPAAQATVGAWQVLLVPTAIAGEVHGAVDVPALTQRLDDADDRPTVLALHHPPRCRSTHDWFRLEGGDELLAALAARPHVRAVLSGHLHDAFVLEGPGGLQLLGGPSTLAAIGHHGDGMTFGEGPTGARVLRLHDDGRLEHELLEA